MRFSISKKAIFKVGSTHKKLNRCNSQFLKSQIFFDSICLWSQNINILYKFSHN